MCSKQRKFLCFTVFLIIFTVSVNEPSAHICAVCFQLWHNFVLRLCIQYAEKKHKQTHRKHANCEQLKINDRILMGKFGKKKLFACFWCSHCFVQKQLCKGSCFTFDAHALDIFDLLAAHRHMVQLKITCICLLCVRFGFLTVQNKLCPQINERTFFSYFDEAKAGTKRASNFVVLSSCYVLLSKK